MADLQKFLLAPNLFQASLQMNTNFYKFQCVTYWSMDW